MKDRIKNMIEKIITPKYPEIISIDDIIDISEEDGLENLEHDYHVSITTSECLNTKKMMEINSEVKTLFMMLGLNPTNPFSFNEPNIRCFFDCGDGEGYIYRADYSSFH
jgi:hypothetical protein